MSSKKHQPSVTQNVTGDNNIVIAGNENTVNQTIIQKFFNIFKSDAETVDQRNRRIMLGHVENFWVKGILEKSLHGAALLELGIKEDSNALSYPWAIKRESNKEPLPTGTSMLEIFQEIGMGRSLLILGAPGSGKTTMLLELTRQLIERAREDVTEPIPVVFNLGSWTEKLTLVDWLARELNTIYYVPKKTAPTWVQENKMLLLLDGLDEVRQESRDKCVDAINQFRKENGLTSIVVCSRIQDYAELKTRLSFDGAIEIQPLTSGQTKEYFQRFGKEMIGVSKLLQKDKMAGEMAETPLFLSIMTLAYRGTDVANIRVSRNTRDQRKYLFDTYVEHMFQRPERSKKERFEKQDVLHYLHWLAKRMVKHNAVTYQLEAMQPSWLEEKSHYKQYFIFQVILIVFILGLIPGLFFGLIGWLMDGIIGAMVGGLTALIFGLASGFSELNVNGGKILIIDRVHWASRDIGSEKGIVGVNTLLLVAVFGYFTGRPIMGVVIGFVVALLFGIGITFSSEQIEETSRPGQRLKRMVLNIMPYTMILSVCIGLVFGFIATVIFSPMIGLTFGLSLGLTLCLVISTITLIKYLALRFVLERNRFLPQHLIPFLDSCTDRIFLRRVGGGYIFVHRLLMEHFADMYPADEK